jgi:NAD-dependent SIR2 family protein deacetylase
MSKKTKVTNAKSFSLYPLDPKLTYSYCLYCEAQIDKETEVYECEHCGEEPLCQECHSEHVKQDHIKYHGTRCKCDVCSGRAYDPVL